MKLIGKWEAKSGEYTVVNALTAWDKRTYNAITVEGDDQKWVKNLHLKSIQSSSRKLNDWWL